jgi:hypothetical protein
MLIAPSWSSGRAAGKRRAGRSEEERQSRTRRLNNTRIIQERRRPEVESGRTSMIERVMRAMENRIKDGAGTTPASLHLDGTLGAPRDLGT